MAKSLEHKRNELQEKLDALCVLAGLGSNYFSVNDDDNQPGVWTRVSVASNPNDFIISVDLALVHFSSPKMQNVICAILAASQPDPSNQIS